MATFYQLTNPNGVPSAAERRKIFRSGGIVVNMDANWTKTKRAPPMVVVPDGASKAQWAAAREYAQRVSSHIKDFLGIDLKPKVVARSENKRGRAGTMHLEPFAVNDGVIAKYFSTEDGAKALARITRETVGGLKDAVISLPHGGKGGRDKGAAGPYGSEVDFATKVAGFMYAADQAVEKVLPPIRKPQAAPKLTKEPSLVREGQQPPAAPEGPKAPELAGGPKPGTLGEAFQINPNAPEGTPGNPRILNAEPVSPVAAAPTPTTPDRNPNRISSVDSGDVTVSPHPQGRPQVGVASGYPQWAQEAFARADDTSVTTPITPVGQAYQAGLAGADPPDAIPTLGSIFKKQGGGLGQMFFGGGGILGSFFGG